MRATRIEEQQELGRAEEPRRIGRPSSAHDVRRMHGAIGNRAVARLLARKVHDERLSVDESQPPVAWAKRPPDLAALTRVELFDARNLIDAWLSGHGQSPDAAQLRTLRSAITSRARNVTTESAYTTLSRYSKVEPGRIRQAYLQVAERIVEDRAAWDYDLDALDELVRDRDPGATWPALAREQLQAVLAEQDREALAIRREQERRAQRQAKLIWPYSAWYERAEARARKLPQDAYGLWHELSWLMIDMLDAGHDADAREQRVFAEISSLYEEMLRQVDAEIQKDCKLNAPQSWDARVRSNIAKAWGDPRKPWFEPGGRGWDELNHFKRMLLVKRDDDPFTNAFYWVEEYLKAHRSLTDPQAQLAAMRQQAYLELLNAAPGALLRFNFVMRGTVVPFLGHKAGGFMRTLMGKATPGGISPTGRRLQNALRNTILGVKLALGDLGGSGAEVGGAARRPVAAAVAPAARATPARVAPGATTPDLPQRPAPARPPAAPAKPQTAPAKPPTDVPAEAPTPLPVKPRAPAPSTPAAKATVPPGRQPARDTLNTLATVADHATVADLRRAVRAKLRALYHGESKLNPMLADVMQVIRSRRLPDTKDNRQLLAYLRTVIGAIRDPAFLENAMVLLWTEAARRGITPREVLEQRIAGDVGYADVTRFLELDEFKALIAGDQPSRDVTFAPDYHGAHVHMFQEYLVTIALGGGDAGRKFRQLIARVTGPDVIEHANSNRPRPFWSALWDALFDDSFGDGHINFPEALGKILQEDLGLPRWFWTPPDPSGPKDP